MDPETMLAAAWQCIHGGRLEAACDLLELGEGCSLNEEQLERFCEAYTACAAAAEQQPGKPRPRQLPANVVRFNRKEAAHGRR